MSFCLSRHIKRPHIGCQSDCPTICLTLDAGMHWHWPQINKNTRRTWRACRKQSGSSSGDSSRGRGCTGWHHASTGSACLSAAVCSFQAESPLQQQPHVLEGSFHHQQVLDCRALGQAPADFLTTCCILMICLYMKPLEALPLKGRLKSDWKSCLAAKPRCHARNPRKHVQVTLSSDDHAGLGQIRVHHALLPPKG